MLKNIQQYLLTRYPIIWNIKIVPMLIVIVAVQLTFFGIGYLMTDNTTSYASSTSSGLYYLLIAASYLVATLLLIYWLVRYNRNNGLRAFYPYTSLQLYIEWLCIFVVCIAIGYIPASLSWGKATKWELAVSKSEQEKTMDLLHKVIALLPTEEYKFELVGNQTPLRVGDAEVNRSKFDTKRYNYAEDALTPDNPIEYVGPSYLYFAENGRNLYYRHDEKANQTVHDWLINQNQDSIRQTMQAFLNLHKKHKMETNLDLDYWMAEVYNPPLYPVNNLISTYKPTYRQNYVDKYTSFDQLYNYYDEVGVSQSGGYMSFLGLIITCSIALVFSILIFSARITSGKSWIFALLMTGVISFAYSLLLGVVALLASFMPSELLIPVFWIALFIILLVVLSIKLSKGSQKGRSNIYINIAIWLVPALAPLMYATYRMAHWKITKSSIGTQDEDFYLLILAIVNLIVVTIAMYPVSIFLRKWKALPEN